MALGAAAASARRRRLLRRSGSGCGAGILAGLAQPGLARVEQALRRPLGGDLDGPQVDQVRARAPGSGMSRSTSLPYQGEKPCLPRSGNLQPLAVDLLLEHDQAVQEGLRRGRAAGNVDIDGEVLVDPRDDVVPFLERAAAGGAGAHRDHVLRLGHLVVEPGDHRHHRLGDGARDDHQVGLARRAAEDLGAEPGDVEPARRRADHLDRAAGQPEAQRPQRRAPAPVVDRVDDPQQLVPVRDQDVLLQLLLEHRVDHRAPLGARDCRIRHDESSVSG